MKKWFKGRKPIERVTERVTYDSEDEKKELEDKYGFSINKQVRIDERTIPNTAPKNKYIGYAYSPFSESRRKFKKLRI